MNEETLYYPFEPSLQLSDLGLHSAAHWEEIDELAASTLGYRLFRDSLGKGGDLLGI